MIYDMLLKPFFNVDSGSEVRIPICDLYPELSYFYQTSAMDLSIEIDLTV